MFVRLSKKHIRFAKEIENLNSKALFPRPCFAMKAQKKNVYKQIKDKASTEDFFYLTLIGMDGEGKKESFNKRNNSEQNAF